MARLWSSGFEQRTTTAGVEWNAITGTPSINTTIFRSGGASLRVNPATAAITQITQRYRANAVVGTTRARAYIYIATAPSVQTAVLRIRDVGQALNTASLRLNTNRTLELWDDDAPARRGVASAVLALNTWYRIELEHIGTAHTLSARINGTEFANGAGASFVDNPNEIQIGFGTAATGDVYFDDVAVNNEVGSFQNSWPDEGSIIHLLPNADGDSTTWTRGGTDSGSNWGQIDEITPNDITDYVVTPATASTDDYNLAPSGITGTVNVVSVGWRYRAAATTSPDSIILRVKASAAGTVEESAAITPNSITWFTNANAIPRVYPLTLYDLPGASTTAWTPADLDTAQIGLRTSLVGVSDGWVSAMWMLVEYIPAAGTPTPPLPIRRRHQAVNRGSTY